MKVYDFKTKLKNDSFTPELSFCVSIGLDALEFINSKHSPLSQDEKDKLFGSIILKEINEGYQEYIKRGK